MHFRLESADLYGRDKPHDFLRGKKDKFSRLVRELIICIDTWLGATNNALGRDKYWYLGREILCDVMASSIYGYSFLYAWFIQMRELYPISYLAHNSAYMFDDFSEELEEDLTSKGKFRSRIKRDFVNMSGKQVNRFNLVVVYYRGIVMLQFLKHQYKEDSISSKNSSSLAKELAQEVEEWLELLLNFITGKDSDFVDDYSVEKYQNYEKGFAKALSDIVIRKPFLKNKKTRKELLFKTKNKVAPDLLSKVAPDLLSDETKNLYITLLKSMGHEVKNPGSIKSLYDGMWRCSWQREKSEMDKEQAILGLRVINMLAFEDYLRYRRKEADKKHNDDLKDQRASIEENGYCGALLIFA